MDQKIQLVLSTATATTDVADSSTVGSTQNGRSSRTSTSQLISCSWKTAQTSFTRIWHHQRQARLWPNTWPSLSRCKIILFPHLLYLAYCWRTENVSLWISVDHKSMTQRLLSAAKALKLTSSWTNILAIGSKLMRFWLPRKTGQHQCCQLSLRPMVLSCSWTRQKPAMQATIITRFVQRLLTLCRLVHAQISTWL